jgi:hypothetical protein
MSPTLVAGGRRYAHDHNPDVAAAAGRNRFAHWSAMDASLGML